MTVNEAKEIKNLLESIEAAGKMRGALSKSKSILTLNIENNYDYMGAHYIELKADYLLQERILETIEQYEKELIEKLSRYSLT